MDELALKNIDRMLVEGASRDYLDCYRDVDIVLDTFPYTGGATVCEALYMGRPVIAMKGDNHGRRFSSSILYYAGFKEFIAKDKGEYAQKAVSYGKDMAYLQQLHGKIRNTFCASRLMDGHGYMAGLEKKYFEIWDRYQKTNNI